jgi:O-antigen ligase
MRIKLGIDHVLVGGTFFGIAAAVLGGPWFFGAWEGWWFWTFALFIMAATLCFGLQLVVRSGGIQGLPPLPEPAARSTRLRLQAIGLMVPFLIYALIRFHQTEVRMDAQRALLLFIFPFLLALPIILVFTESQRRKLAILIGANFFGLGLYGLINHAANGSRWVLNQPGFAQYVNANRATGSYFCPDHFAGLMELALAAGLAWLASRNVRWPLRLAAFLLTVMSLMAVILSRSRGGGMTVLFMLAMLITLGFSQWPRHIRLWFRLIAAAVSALAVLLVICTSTQYVTRFITHFGIQPGEEVEWKTLPRTAARSLKESCRGQMYAAALRAWRTSRNTQLYGIGPGMHQNLWPAIAASPDGNRATHKWPSHPNNTYYSYKVHNDWLQLLEEFGITGLLLFLLPAGFMWHLLVRRLSLERRRLRRSQWRLTGTERHPMILTALLAFAAMGFHSLGDFNLQLPATGWVLGALLALGLADATCEENPPAMDREPRLE